MSVLRAFFNPPSADAAGLLPLLVDNEDGSYSVRGFEVGAPRRLTRIEAKRLIEDEHVLQVPPMKVPDSAECAGWLGVELQRRISASAMAPPLRHDQMAPLDGLGSFWLGSTADVYAWLQQWASAAATFVLNSKDRRLADLLLWVLPGLPIVCAARWYAADNTERPRLLPLLRRRMIETEPENVQSELERLIRKSRGESGLTAPFLSMPRGRSERELAPPASEVIASAAQPVLRSEA